MITAGRGRGVTGGLRDVVAARPWTLTFLGAGLVIGVLHLAGLGSAPPGLYNDEASIGYNAWSIAHHGVDEHGAHLPLYFEAFGEYKNPLYIYLLAPLTWVLPLTPAVERLPAALCGLGVCALVALIAWQLTRSRAVALGALLVAGCTPWLTLQSRVGFEVPVMTLTLTLAIWCLVRAQEAADARAWLAGAGTALGLSVFAYSTGRAFVAGLVVAMLVVDARWRRPRMLWLLGPVAGAYAVLAAYGLTHPGALTNRFGALSITSDQPGILAVAGRFLRNYLTYDSIPFLFTNGDANLRHNTGYGGMLLVVTAPLLLLGVVRCLRTVRHGVSGLLLVGLVVAPAPAALTAEGTPHALRAATMLPFLLVLVVLGIAELLPLLTARRLLAGAVALAVAADAGGFLFDLYVRYPGRSLAWFDAGELAAVTRAHDLAAGHRVYLSERLDDPYIQALFAFHPDPVAEHVPASIVVELEELGMASLPDATSIAASARPGDLMVLAPDELPPQGSTLVDVEQVEVAPEAVSVQPPAPPVVLAQVWRR